VQTLAIVKFSQPPMPRRAGEAGVGDQSKLAVGSTPNLAARLQGLAAADRIVIASSTRRPDAASYYPNDYGIL
jgi:hypothetical protein